MLTFEQIKELIELVATHRMSGCEIERSGFRLKIDGYPAPVVASPVAAAPPATAPPGPPAMPPPAMPSAAVPEDAPAAAVSDTASPKTEHTEAHALTSPIVGTFYAAPSPDADPFVSVGDKVKKGQVLCIVEAMKLMNEIESDVDGVVRQVLPQNGQPVEYGEPLFFIEVR